MNVFEELNATLEEVEKFRILIEGKLAHDQEFLKKSYGNSKGEPYTVLNYLIERHSNEINLSEHIRALIEEHSDTIDFNLGQPLHLILSLKKSGLFDIFIERLDCFNLNQRDSAGKTLLFRLMDNRDITLLTKVLSESITVHEWDKVRTSIKHFSTVQIQPIHHAILLNYGEAIQPLVRANSDLNNPCGELQETPLLLAARLGRSHMIQNLIHASNDLEKQLNLDICNAKGERAIDLLCLKLGNKQERDSALKGIALLLINGATISVDSKILNTLSKHRSALLDEIKLAESSEDLRANFVRAVSLNTNPLHQIFYPKTFSNSIRTFFGKPEQLAVKLISLVTNEKNESGDGFTKDEKDFFEFFERYQKSIKGHRLYNPWSTMHVKLSNGEITNIAQVKAYAAQNKKTRTARILKEIEEKDSLIVHSDLGFRDKMYS